MPFGIQIPSGDGDCFTASQALLNPPEKFVKRVTYVFQL